MVKVKDYWVSNNAFIFKPYFNSNISIYKNKIINYKQLIFSNYNRPNLCFTPFDI